MNLKKMKVVLVLVLVGILGSTAAYADTYSFNTLLTNFNCQQMHREVTLLQNYNVGIMANYEQGTFVGSNDGKTYTCRISGSISIPYGLPYGQAVQANSILTNLDCDAIARDFNLLSTPAVQLSSSCQRGNFQDPAGLHYHFRIITYVSR